MNWVAAETFDRWLTSRLEPCHVFHFLSSFGMHAQREARRRYGAVTVCDRGSSHILHQDRILAEEFSKWRVAHRRFDRRIVERELGEYDEADVILVPSEFVYRTFLEHGVQASKLVKIPYGVDLRMFRPTPKIDDVFRVLYVGAISLRKGIPYLLEAVAHSSPPGVELWLVGSVEDDAPRFLAEYQGTYRWFGYTQRAELYRYYGQASVFVLASIQEGLATVLAQAMACGLPVIATANTGAEDVITDGVEGFIVPIRDPVAIREKLVYLYEHPEVRRAMSEAALRRVRLMSGWNNYGQAVVDCYHRQLASRSANDRSGTCVSR